jgi:hypothetical protein
LRNGPELIAVEAILFCNFTARLRSVVFVGKAPLCLRRRVQWRLALFG